MIGRQSLQIADQIRIKFEKILNRANAFMEESLLNVRTTSNFVQRTI